MPEVAVINGRLSPTTRAVVPVDDWAVRYGWGLFETIRIHKGCPLFLDRHLARLCEAAKLLELSGSSIEESGQWRRDIRKALAHAAMREGIINCYWTRGSMLAQIRPSRIVRIRPRPRYPSRPLQLWVAPWRIEPTYPGTGVKTLAYFPYIFAGLAARREGLDEAIVLNTANCVADGAASSIFVVKGGKILTPSLDQGTLPGVTRGIVLDIARSLNLPLRETRIPWKTLLLADEVFITSSLRGVFSVGRIAGHWKKSRVDKSQFKSISMAYAAAIAESVKLWNKAS